MKLSLNIGLNALDPSAYHGFSGWLVACENDATALASLAASRGFESVGQLTSRATLSDFRAALLNASQRLGDGDSFFLTFSGHGGQLFSLGESDGYNETLCFWDGQLVDNEFRDLLARFKPGVNVLVILDSCHSGGMDKALDSLRRPRVLPLALRRKFSAANATDGAGAPSPRTALPAPVTILTACAEAETASDGATFGEWTGALLESWFPSSVSDWYSRAAKLTNGQTPQLKILGLDQSQAEALA